MSFCFKKIIFPLCVLFAVVFLAFCCIFKNHAAKNKSDGYVLKSYKNTVALYSGDTPLKIYDNVILNTLPENDIINFNKGINFDDTAEAEKYIEDFD